MLVFRQLFDPTSSTYTYLLGCSVSREAVLIDPVFEQVRRDAALIGELGLQLKWTLDTHVHADHVTGAWLLKQKLGSGIALSAAARRLGRRPAARRRRPRRVRPPLAGSARHARPHQRLRHLRARRREHGLHRRLHHDPRLGPHRLPAGRPARALPLGALAHLLAARDLPALSRRTTIAGSPPPASPRRRSSIRGWAARSARATTSAT